MNHQQLSPATKERFKEIGEIIMTSEYQLQVGVDKKGEQLIYIRVKHLIDEVGLDVSELTNYEREIYEKYKGL